MSQHFSSGGQSIGASALASVLPIYGQDWFSLGMTGLISLQCKGLWRVLSNTTLQKHYSLTLSLPHGLTLISIYRWFLDKTIALTVWTYVGKIMTLIFNRLSRLVISFLPRTKHFLISWLQSPSAVILEPKKIKSHCFHCFPIYLLWSDGTGSHNISFLNECWVLSQLFHSPLSLSSRSSLVCLHFLP